MFKKHLILKLALVAFIIVFAAVMLSNSTSCYSSVPLVSFTYLNETVIPALTSKLEGMVGDAKT